MTYILNITIANAQESVTFPDSAKHSLIQPETPFIPELQYEELLSQPELPPVVPDFAPVTFKYAKERYQPVFLTDQTPYHYGEYRVSGVIRSFSNGALIGYGSQENWIGVGTFNTAAIGYIHNFSDRLTINTYLEAGKISIPRNINNSLTLRSSVSYRITDRLSLTGFGNIGTTRFHPMQ